MGANHSILIHNNLLSIIPADLWFHIIQYMESNGINFTLVITLKHLQRICLVNAIDNYLTFNEDRYMYACRRTHQKCAEISLSNGCQVCTSFYLKCKQCCQKCGGPDSKFKYIHWNGINIETIKICEMCKYYHFYRCKYFSQVDNRIIRLKN